MFQVADLVKFAKAQPPVDFHEQVLREAEQFILETKQDEKEEEDVVSAKTPKE